MDLLANVYLYNKKIGTVADYGDGGGYEICIEQEKNVFEETVQNTTKGILVG